jgi:tRNA-splicing ligase RtcB
MRVDGMVYADAELLRQIESDQTAEQIANVATLPGLVGKSLAMPDAHQGYGFCIGGVAAADLENGIVSAGGVGFDINCGVRLLAVNADPADVRAKLATLLDQLFRDIPCGTGSKGPVVLDEKELDEVLSDGARWAARHSFGDDKDLARIEEFGCLPDAGPKYVSSRAKERGHRQLGTLGSGNHFLEIQEVKEIYDDATARVFGVRLGQIVVLIHSGSRGLGHQVCTDYLDLMDEYEEIRDQSCGPSTRLCAHRFARGESYLRAMGAAANFAFANRQMMTHGVREVFRRVIGTVDIQVVYDVCHNIAKKEEHRVNVAVARQCWSIARATQAFPERTSGAGMICAASVSRADPGEYGHRVIHPGWHRPGDGRDVWLLLSRRRPGDEPDASQRNHRRGTLAE